MTGRALLLSVAVVAPGCADVLPGGSSEAPAVTLPVAPAPRSKGEAPPPAGAAAPRPSKPLSALIVGRWWHVNREGCWGDKVREYTADGKVIERYSYRARLPSHPAGSEVGTWEYRLDGNVFGPESVHDDGHDLVVYTRAIDSLTENELVILWTRRTSCSPADVQARAARLGVPLAKVLAAWREESGRLYYVRLKDK